MGHIINHILNQDALKSAIDAHMYDFAREYRRVPLSNGGTHVEYQWPATGRWIPAHDWFANGLEMSGKDIMELAEKFYHLGKKDALREFEL